MITLFLFVSFGYSVISTEKPFHIAAAFAVVSALLTLVFGGSIVGFLIEAAVLFIYASILYYILDSFGEGIFMSFAILLGGALGLFFIPLMLLS